MAKEKTHNDMTQEEREQEARDYVESQEPMVPEQPVVLNEFGQHVPDESKTQRVQTESAPAPAKKAAKKGRR